MAVLACSEDRPPAPAPPPPAKFPALTGSWSGGAEVTPYGPVRATLFVGAEGWGSVTVMAKGHVLTRRFQILAWDGREARIDQSGTVYLIDVRLAGEALRIDVPSVGEVELRRPP